ncbi:MAG TPA: peptidoglycan DD-metalloendopeptidase family protein [Caulobacterales bacterium]|nr:peptidoglycan DD-metalloendopeptidase family protein [Caulobacterales bacterium]
MLALAMLQARLMYHHPARGSVARSHIAPAARTEAAARRDRDLERDADLIVPVYGVGVSQLADTWGAARAAGRVHQGVDILAPAGTIVRAVAPGMVAKLFFSEHGGITVYEMSADGRYIFYYAHLQRYALCARPKGRRYARAGPSDCLCRHDRQRARSASAF